MSDSKKKKIEAAVLPVLVIIFLCISEALISYLLVPVNSATYFKKEISEFETQGLDADIVFLGSSRVYHSFVPEIFEKKLGLDLVINAGSSTQRPESSYYLLRDLYGRVHPKTVILGVQWNAILEESTDAQRLESAVTACDRMSLAGRLGYVPNYLLSPQLPYFCNMYRFRDNLRIDTIRENLEKHASLDSEGIVVDKSRNTYYADTGFIYSNLHCEAGNIPIMDENQDSFSVELIDKDKIRYIDKIIDFCRQHDIRLILVASPVAMMNMYHINGYDDAVKYFQQYAAEKGIAFHNLNYLKGREALITDDKMSDYIHLAGDTAALVSDIYSDILKEEMDGKDISGYFYNDLDSLKKEVDRVVGVRAAVSLNDDGSDHISVEALANEEETILYRIEGFSEGSEDRTVLYDWNPANEMDVRAADGLDRFVIKACIEGDEENYAWQEYGVKRAKLEE